MRTLRLKIEKQWVFLKTEIRRDTENLIGFGAKYIGILFLCFTYGFFFKSALWQKNIQLNGHPIDFPLFLISGLAAVRIVPFSIKIFNETLLGLKGPGLMEWVLVTPTGFWELFAARALWNGIRALIELCVLIGAARLFIGIPLRPFLQSDLILPVFLMFAAYAGIGMIISSVSLFLKKEAVLFTFFFQISAAFGGVFFPTKLFSGKFQYLEWISNSLPITHALNAIRLVLIHEKKLDVLRHERLLALLTLVFFSTGFIFLQRSLAWARKNGGF